MDIENPGPWIDELMKDFPEERFKRFGRIKAFREYVSHVGHLPKAERDRLLQLFYETMDERFPSEAVTDPEAPETP